MRRVELPPTLSGTYVYDREFATVAPRYVERRRHGIRLIEVPEDSLAHDLGLHPGDIILEVDREECTDIESCRRAAFRLRTALEAGAPFVLLVEREARVSEVHYRYAAVRPVY